MSAWKVPGPPELVCVCVRARLLVVECVHRVVLHGGGRSSPSLSSSSSSSFSVSVCSSHCLVSHSTISTRYTICVSVYSSNIHRQYIHRYTHTITQVPLVDCCWLVSTSISVSSSGIDYGSADSGWHYETVPWTTTDGSVHRHHHSQYGAAWTATDCCVDWHCHCPTAVPDETPWTTKHRGYWRKKTWPTASFCCFPATLERR